MAGGSFGHLFNIGSHIVRELHKEIPLPMFQRILEGEAMKLRWRILGAILVNTASKIGSNRARLAFLAS
jgi:hypothetical protein